MPDQESWRFIGQRIRLVRKSNQLTIKQLANGCGLSSNAISLVERGEVAPTVSTLCKIAHALGATVASFFDQACPEEDAWPGNNPAAPGSASMECALIAQADDPAGNQDSGLVHSRQSTPHNALPSILCVSGQLEYSQDSRRHRLGPGETILIDHSRPHALRNTGNEPGIALLVFPASSKQLPQEKE